MTDEINIIKIIKRRQAKFQDQLRPGPQEQMDEVARLITEEYDALLAEIEAVRSKSRDETAVAINSKAKRDNEMAEAEILGDLGQLGG
jgi:predicted transcriptional regulator